METRDQTPPAAGREETELERYDRNLSELMGELRVALPGVQVLFAFLLVVPFYNRFPHLSRFERDDYFATLVCVAIASMLLIAPSVHHRLLFRRGEKEFLVKLGSQMAIVASVFLALGFTGIFLLISDVLFGSGSDWLVAGLMGVFVVSLWFGVPLVRRLRE